MILLPVLNEAEAVPDILQRIPTAELQKSNWKTNVILIDGGSEDGTVEIASAYDCQILNQIGKGKGSAMRQGFELFIDGEDDALVILDADGTYHPEDIPRLLKKLETCDVVVGDRLRGSMEQGAMTRFNYLGNLLLTWMAVFLHGMNINDLCTGYWAFNRDTVETLKLNSIYFEIEAEMYSACAFEGLNLQHVPIRYSVRKGEAKLGSVRDGVAILRKLIVRRLFPTPHEG